MRTTKKELRALFGHLCKALGRAESTESREPGSWYLGHNSVYGWGIVEVGGEGQGELQPFGLRNYSAGELATAIRFALEAIKLKQGGQS